MGWGQGKVVLDDETNQKYIDDIPENWEIRVPLVLPDEIVKVRIFKNMEKYSEGDLVDVIQSSSYRVKPNCPLAGKCGGCQFQHMNIEKQRDWKTRYVKRGLIEQQIDGYCNDNNDVFRLTTTLLGSCC